MLNTLRDISLWGARLKVLLAALLLAGSGAARAANVTLDLCATTGSVTLPPASAPVTLPVYGYAAGACTPTSAVTAPGGPVIDVAVGDVVTVNLSSRLPTITGLLFQGQGIVPDLTGIAVGGTKSYTFTATSPGTYLYEAAPLANAQHQVAMGLYGALVVRPTTSGQAYDAAATAFNDEATLVLAEVDPALNNSVDPAAFDLRAYTPKYFLINGKAYPDTATIGSVPGNRLLLRYVNAGAKQHSMAVLGLRQVFVAKDGNPLPQLNHDVVAESIATGQTADAIVTIPGSVTTATRYAVYDAGLSLHNSNAPGFGGMLTFVTAGTGSGTTGPTTSAVSLAPNPTNGSASVTLSAALASAASTVAAAEYFIDAPGAAGTGTAMAGSFGGATASANAVVSTAQLAALTSGKHTFYVHGQDAGGQWGVLGSGVLNLDKAGPATGGLTLTPNPSTGAVSVALGATGNDANSGGSNVVAAEYFVGVTGADGAGTAMAVNVVAPIASLSATIPSPVAGGVVYVHSQDSLGNWGPFATITLLIGADGPVTSGVTASRNPNNGAFPLTGSQPVVRVTATMTSSASTVAGGEGFIDAVGANGTGFPFVPSDGAWTTSTEVAYVDVPLVTIGALAEGNHTIYVRGRDAVGNWGSSNATAGAWPTAAKLTLTIDKTAPTFAGITLAPTPTLGATSVVLTVDGAVDPVSNGVTSGVAGGEYWINPPTSTDPAPGGGTAFSGLTANIPVGALATGAYTVRARIRDAAGNWSSGANGIRQAALSVVPDAIFANGFETGSLPWGWSSASTTNATRLSVTTASALVGSRSLQALGNNTNYVQFNFGTAANPAWPTYDARFYFRPNGTTSTGKDIFAAATASNFGSNLFHVRYRLVGATPQVQIQVGGTANATWTNLLGGTSDNLIEVVWQSGSTLQLVVNGVVAQTLPATVGSVAAVRLGSVTNAGNNSLMYFDAFASKRTVAPLLGP